MGVQGLTKFVNKHAKPFNWSSTDTTVIVDGKSFLYHFLDNLDWRFGGENAKFYQRLTAFLSAVPKHVTFYVLMDGVNQTYKLTTLHSRRNARKNAIIQGLSDMDKPFSSKKSIRTAWIMDIFLQTLNAYNAHIHFIDGEADFALQAYARKYNAYILSDDSDALLLESRGVLRIRFQPRVSAAHAKEAACPYILEIMDHKSVLRALKLSSVHHLHIFGSLLGNDISRHIIDSKFTDRVRNVSPSKRGHYFHILSALIKKSGTLSECLDRINVTNEQRVLFESAAALYVRNEPRQESKFLSLAETGQCSEYLMQALEYGHLFYSILPEDPNKACSMECTKKLRQFIYALANVSQCKEIKPGIDTEEEEEVCGIELSEPSLNALCDALGLVEYLDTDFSLKSLVTAYIKKYHDSNESNIYEAFEQWLQTGSNSGLESRCVSNTHCFTLYQTVWSHFKTLLVLLGVKTDETVPIYNVSSMY